VKHGIQVGAGVIDPDYRGELKVVLFNHDMNPYVIKSGYRIAQLVLERYEAPDIEEVFESTETQRGEGGFGSTGQ
jgi:dUTP pyrophosphatase